MIVKKYKAVVNELLNPYEDVFQLELITQGAGFRFLPGQFLHLALDSDYDGVGQWPESRCFSMQSSPSEKNLKLTFSLKGGFTTRMRDELQKGSQVWLKMPYGDLFVRDHRKTKTVFIAGGTGITPFMSLFSHPSFAEYSEPRLYLGFRSAGYDIFSTEIGAMFSKNPGSILRVFYEDVQGRLDIERIFAENGLPTSYFISGPPEMIRSFRAYLLSQDVDPQNILTDDWE